jgi:hypothetical protein
MNETRRSGEHVVPKDDSDAVPIETIISNDPVQRAILKLLTRIIADVGAMKDQLTDGRNVIEEVRDLPVKFAVMQSELSTIKLIAYGAVTVTCLGALGTAGAAIFFFIRLTGGHPS